MKTPPTIRPALMVLEGGREALEREALVAVIFDEPRYDEIKRRLFEHPPPSLRLIESCATSRPPEPEAPLP